MKEIERAINLISEGEIDYSGIYDCEINERVTEVILNALREQAERDKGCEFCRKPYKSIDSGKGGKEKSILYMGGNSPYAQLSKQYLHYMDVVGRMDLFEVKFCPMCGKRLEVEP